MDTKTLVCEHCGDPATDPANRHTALIPGNKWVNGLLVGTRLAVWHLPKLPTGEWNCYQKWSLNGRYIEPTCPKFGINCECAICAGG